MKLLIKQIIFFTIASKSHREKKFFFLKTLFKENIVEDQRNVLLNATDLYNGRSKIINLFENKSIESNYFPHNAKSELESELELYLKAEPLFEESIPEKVKMRRQKKYDEENQEG